MLLLLLFRPSVLSLGELSCNAALNPQPTTTVSVGVVSLPASLPASVPISFVWFTTSAGTSFILDLGIEG